MPDNSEAVVESRAWRASGADGIHRSDLLGGGGICKRRRRRWMKGLSFSVKFFFQLAGDLIVCCGRFVANGVLIAGLGNGGRESCGVVAHGGEWVLVVFLITSSSLKPIALSQFDVGQYASTLGLMMGS
uniref:Uncharacterized protein n=1 Tax=Fagus sylvatica TaxID=28930 RepID=A0A2N9I6E3_FAGSY